MTTPTSYLSTAQAAQTLGVDIATVRAWILNGILPAVRLSGGRRGRFRIDQRDLVLVLEPARRAKP